MHDYNTNPLATLAAIITMYQPQQPQQTQQPTQGDVVPYQPRDEEQEGHWSYRVMQGLTFLAAFFISYLFLKFLIWIPGWIGRFLDHLKDLLGLNRAGATDEEQQPLLPAPEEPTPTPRGALGVESPMAIIHHVALRGPIVARQNRSPQEEQSQQPPPVERATSTSRPSNRSSSPSRPPPQQPAKPHPGGGERGRRDGGGAVGAHRLDPGVEGIGIW
ncbi:hypothetical protein PG996_011852 [Apiospora saccharicola]|uniref:Uncharacterized protein n=1 Tax=Apiospora saccharicola TaxID=335842 RepID=A0ABR1UG86_9PEZI